MRRRGGGLRRCSWEESRGTAGRERGRSGEQGSGGGEERRRATAWQRQRENGGRVGGKDAETARHWGVLLMRKIDVPRVP